MIKVLSIIVFIGATSCSSVNADKRFEDAQNHRIGVLEAHIIRLYYFQAHQECFTRYNYCRISNTQKECWPAHEQCVINIDKQYQGKI